MGALVSDAEALIDHLEIRDCVFVGLSIGGMIAQGLAVKRMDQVRAMVLSNTGAKIGTSEMWADRIAAWRNMLVRQPVEGYAGCSAAISGTDFYTTTASLTLPTLGIAGSDDGSTPPDLVRETVDLVKGSDFHLIRNAGHLPCVEKPEEYAEVLTDFLTRIGHV